jgi:thiosulfate reductase cytochrome b subunit
MTSLQLNPHKLNARSNLFQYLRLVLPSYRFALTAIARLWRPICVGAAIVFILAFIREGFLPIPTSSTDWSLSFILQTTALLVVSVTGFFVFGAKIWSDGFTLLQDNHAKLNWSFGQKEMAALRALRDVIFSSFVAGILPFLLMTLIAAMPKWILGLGDSFEQLDTYTMVARTIAGMLLWEIIYARYFLAIPTAIAEAPLDRQWPDICGRALERVRPHYGSSIVVLIALAAISAGLSFVFDWTGTLVQNFATAGTVGGGTSWIQVALKAGRYLAEYAHYVIAALVVIFIATHIWKQTNESGFD